MDYKELAMNWRPDMYLNNKSEAEAKSKQISEAYDVLSDPEKRAVYDMYGEEGLKSRSNPRSADMHRKAPPIEWPLPCSLEDLYNGTTKKMKISRNIIDARGKKVTVEEILTINIKPGWKKGTKITFPEKGNDENPSVISADIAFIIEEKPHKVFTRDGDDLVATQEISVVEALTGYTVRLTSLDGRNLIIPINTIIHPNYEEVVPREGMPIPKDPSTKGNLRIKFEINFPTSLKASQKAGIKELFGVDSLNRLEECNYVNVGKVKRVVDTVSQQYYVVKTIPLRTDDRPFDTNEEVDIQRLLRNQTHPNIIKPCRLPLLYPGGFAKIIYSFVLGESFAGRIYRTEGSLAYMFGQVLNALAYLHSLKVVHLNIQDSHILAYHYGKIILTGFGNARITDEDVAMMHITAPRGERAKYMPPEIRAKYMPPEILNAAVNNRPVHRRYRPSTL
nr:DnaJ homolog subfamily B member 13-like [Ipomoea batatas]